MKTINIKLVLLFFSFWSAITLMGQTVNCNSSIFVSLNAIGEVFVNPDMVTEGNISIFDTVWVDTEYLNCDNIGLNDVSVFAINPAGDTSTCVSTLNIQDLLNPVAIAYSDPEVTLGIDGTYQLQISDIDAGNFDNCNFSTILSPSIISCGMPNPTLVTMTVIDDAGNTSSAVTNVFYKDDYSFSMVCDQGIVVSFPTNATYLVDTDLVLDDPYNGPCSTAMWVILTVDGVPRPDNTLTANDYGSTILAEVYAGNSSCVAYIEAVSADCPFAFTEDMVIWPTDVIYYDDFCDYKGANFSPDFMYSVLGLDSAQCYVQYDLADPCQYTAEPYSDTVIKEDFVTKILRKWTVIEWYSGTLFEKIQVIKIYNETTLFCDTQPWNTPFGDCASGHTDTDDVEWPADITISTSAYLPSHLAVNPAVNPNDAQPQIFETSCSPIYISYDDVLTIGTNDQHIVARTWNAYTWFGVSATYVQTITVNYASNDVYCAYRKSGSPIPGVEMAPGFITDATGCVDLSSYSGDMVTPEKFSPASDGVDVLDQLAIYENILSINPFNCVYQTYAADFNENGSVSTLDLVLLERMINGTQVPAPERIWTFFDIADGTQSINKSDDNPFNTFIGVKLGDVNDSYDLGNFTNPNETELFVDDEILNDGQSYRVPFFNPTTEIVSAFSLTFKKEVSFKLKNVFAPYLPGFTIENNVKVTDDKITISYVVPQEVIEQSGGVIIDKSIPMVTMVIEANKNGILSEEIKLTDINQNIIKTKSMTEAAQIKLIWDGQIISKVNEPLETVEVSMSPNPTSGLISIAYDKSLVADSYIVLDLQGRSIMSGHLGLDAIDVQYVDAGIYILKVRFTNGKVGVQKFIKL